MSEDITVMQKVYEVIVSNLGRVLCTNDQKQARDDFDAYIKISLTGVGKAGGESVDLYCDGDIIDSFMGELHEEELIV